MVEKRILIELNVSPRRLEVLITRERVEKGEPEGEEGEEGKKGECVRLRVTLPLPSLSMYFLMSSMVRVSGQSESCSSSSLFLPDLINFDHFSTMPASKKAKGATPKSSPSKQSAKSKGKRKATTPKTTPSSRRARVQHDPTGLDDDGEQDDDDEGEQDGGRDESPESFVSASAGDAFLLYSTQTTRTTDSLLSTSVDPAFTLSSYTSALRSFDSLDHPAIEAQRAVSEGKVQRAQDRFSRWVWELQHGFNILLTGVGSKRTVLNDFAEKARRKGNVVVVNGFDTAVAVGDLITALEDLVRLQGGDAPDEDEDEVGPSTPRKRKRGGAAAAIPSKKGKGRAGAPAQPAATTTGAYTRSRPVSAIESRARRLCASLRSAKLANPSFPPIFLVLHSLDAPSLRLPKTISLLALLAAQSGMHLIASVDHVRSSLLFPTSLATARPPTASVAATSASSSDLADLALTFRTFTFLYYDVSTLLPYTVETLSLGTLSTLLPRSVFPPLSASLDPTASSLAQSATHVLASVTDRARRLFNMLGQEQVRTAEACPREVERGMRLDGGAGTGREGEKAPVVAMTLNSFVTFLSSLPPFPPLTHLSQPQGTRHRCPHRDTPGSSRRFPRRVSRPRRRSKLEHGARDH